MRKRRINIFVCILLALFSIAFLYWNGEVRFQSPFMKQYVFESVSEAVKGSNGNTYVVDGGRKSVIVLDDENRLIRKLQGGSESSDFFYAGRICGDASGNIYIADTISGMQGNRIQKERIIKIEKNKSSVMYEFDYTTSNDPPMQYGNILELQEYDDYIYFLKKEVGHIDIYRISTDGKTQQIEKLEEIPCSFFLNDAAYDVSTETVVVTTRLGEVYRYNPETDEWLEISAFSKEQIPWRIASVNGEVYYTDLQAGGIVHFSLSEPEQAELVYQNDSSLYSLSISPDGKIITVTDNTKLMYLDSTDYHVSLCAEASIGNRIKVVLFWLVLSFVVLAEGILIFTIIKESIRNLTDRSGLSRIVLVVSSSIVVAVLASYSSISVLMDNHDEIVMNHMKLFAESLVQQIDGEELKKLDSLSDYHSETYMEIKNRLDSMVSSGYENDIYYYYIIYYTDGKNMNAIMDYEDTMVCSQPIYKYGDNDYSMVMDTGEARTVSETSSYGSWIFTLLPIKDESGNIVAELEVGSNLDKEVYEKRELIKENMITVLCSCGVMVMLVLECIFTISFFEKRRGLTSESRDMTQQMPIRTMVFLVYMTDSMQDAFIAILCSRLYTDNLPISQELAIALPMSLQLMMAAIFSMFGGKFAAKVGIRRTMQLGLLSQLGGFLICALVPGYTGILIGKIFIGIGLGTVYVTSNTMASMGESPDSIESAFADVSAGVLSGVTIGVGLGSIILSFADYRMVYLIGAIFMAGGILLTLSAKNVRLKENTERPRGGLNVVKFLFSRRIIMFFSFILVPFMMALSYREYFFPLYVEQFGMDEVQIGRIYLGCGMLVLYIGPFLSKYILKVFGAKKSIVLASLCMACNMGLFVLMPNIYSVMIGMVILAVVISFAYTCQYTYFEGLSECTQVGMGNAMGIYSMFENVGQTLGPVVYGAALMLGNREGIFVLFILMLLLICLFAKFGIKRGKKYDRVFRNRRKRSGTDH